MLHLFCAPLLSLHLPTPLKCNFGYNFGSHKSPKGAKLLTTLRRVANNLHKNFVKLCQQGKPKPSKPEQVYVYLSSLKFEVCIYIYGQRVRSGSGLVLCEINVVAFKYIIENVERYAN